MSKSHSRFVEITYDGNDISSDVKTINGIGIQRSQVDVAGLDRSLDEFIQGRGSLNLEVGGPFNNESNQAHETIEPLVDDADGAVLLIQIGANAAPTTGDAEFNGTAIIVTGYTVSVADDGAVMYSASLRPGVGSTASWDTV